MAYSFAMSSKRRQGRSGITGKAGWSAASKALAAQLAQIGREFHARGWAYGTSGNYSAALRQQPLALLITSSGLDKSALTEHDFLEIDASGKVLSGAGKPSAETFLHLTVMQERNAACVLHTHSVWSTLLSERHAAAGGLAISGYEMLKGLQGVQTHQHREWIPIFENDQDMSVLAKKVSARLREDRNAHGFLLAGHGLYTWGENIAQARRHVEILEFLFEVVGRVRRGRSSRAAR